MQTQQIQFQNNQWLTKQASTNFDAAKSQLDGNTQEIMIVRL